MKTVIKVLDEGGMRDIERQYRAVKPPIDSLREDLKQLDKIEGELFERQRRHQDMLDDIDTALVECEEQRLALESLARAAAA